MKDVSDCIPIELLRTFVAILDQQGFTKAAHAVGLTQSAISAQVKRLQRIVGGDVFEKSGGALALTDRGKVVEHYGRRILELNERLLLHAGNRAKTSTLRIGLPISLTPTLFVDVFKACKAAAKGFDLQFISARSDELLKSLEHQYLDVAMVVSWQKPSLICVAEWPEPFGWVQSPNLLVRPGAPIPYISWPNSQTDRIAREKLERAGLRYEITFASTDYMTRRVALEGGLGFMASSTRSRSSSVVLAAKKFLPPLECPTGLICVREDFSLEDYGPVIAAFKAAAPASVQQD